MISSYEPKLYLRPPVVQIIVGIGISSAFYLATNELESAYKWIFAIINVICLLSFFVAHMLSTKDYIIFLLNKILERIDEEIEYLMLDQHVESEAFKNKVAALTRTLNELIPKYIGDYRDKLINRRNTLTQLSVNTQVNTGYETDTEMPQDYYGGIIAIAVGDDDHFVKTSNWIPT